MNDSLSRMWALQISGVPFEVKYPSEETLTLYVGTPGYASRLILAETYNRQNGTLRNITPIQGEW